MKEQKITDHVFGAVLCIIYILFIYSGVYEYSWPFHLIPNLTYLLAPILGVVAVLGIIRKSKWVVCRPSLNLISVFILIAGYAAISLIWTPSTSYGPIKVVRFAGGAGLTLLVPVVLIGTDRKRTEFLLIGLAVAGLVFSIAVLRRGGAVPLNAPNYITISRPIGIATIVTLILAIRSVSLIRVILWSSSSFIMILSLLMTGARAPLLMTIFCSTLAIIWAVVVRNEDTITGTDQEPLGAKIIPGLGVLTGIISLFIILSTSIGTYTISRLMRLTSDGFGASVSGRFARYTLAYSRWTENIITLTFGNGIGAFGVFWFDDSTGHQYPHNLILEVGVEMGVIGLVLFGLLFYTGVVSTINRRTLLSPPHVTFYLIFLYMLGNAMVSGDIYANKYIYMGLGMVAPWITYFNLSETSDGSRELFTDS